MVDVLATTLPPRVIGVGDVMTLAGGAALIAVILLAWAVMAWRIGRK